MNRNGIADRAGMTLVELMVVLAILAVLTVVAVQSTDYLVDQSRYDATQRTLQNVQAAIVGPANQVGANGSPLITGFAADMGRLPQPVAAGGDPLRELWDASVIPAASMFNATPVTLTQFSTPITVQFPCGWRGPYLQPPATQQALLLDGWGNPFDVLTPGNALAGVGQAIGVVRSRGADDQVDPSPLTLPYPAYNQDQYAPAQSYVASGGTLALPSPLSSFATTGTVQVNVQGFNSLGGQPVLAGPVTTTVMSTSYDSVQVFVFAPANGVLTAFASNVTSLSPTAPTTITFPFLSVPIGPRAIQAFQYASTTKAVGMRSPLTYITVTPNNTPMQTLVLQ